MNCAQVLLEGLKAMGSRRVYGVVGTSNVALVSSLYDYDGMYRVLNFRQRMQYEGRVIGTCHGNPDFADLARTFGASGWRLERPEEIRTVLEQALQADGPAVVDVIVDSDDMPPANIEAALRMSG